MGCQKILRFCACPYQIKKGLFQPMYGSGTFCLRRKRRKLPAFLTHERRDSALFFGGRDVFMSVDPLAAKRQKELSGLHLEKSIAFASQYASIVL